MKCKECNQQMDPKEVDEILSQLVDGLKPERICEDCLDKMYDEPYPYDGTSEFDD